MGKNDKALKYFFDILGNEIKDNTLDEPMEIGKVTNLSPLTIEVNGLPLYESNLDINKDLLAWDEIVSIAYESNTNQTATIHHPSKLQIGNYVALYGMEWNELGKTYQKYQLMYVIN
jgi:hypothetical protein